MPKKKRKARRSKEDEEPEDPQDEEVAAVAAEDEEAPAEAEQQKEEQRARRRASVQDAARRGSVRRVQTLAQMPRDPNRKDLARAEVRRTGVAAFCVECGAVYSHEYFFCAVCGAARPEIASGPNARTRTKPARRAVAAPGRQCRAATRWQRPLEMPRGRALPTPGGLGRARRLGLRPSRPPVFFGPRAGPSVQAPPCLRGRPRGPERCFL